MPMTMTHDTEIDYVLLFHMTAPLTWEEYHAKIDEALRYVETQDDVVFDAIVVNEVGIPGKDLIRQANRLQRVGEHPQAGMLVTVTTRRHLYYLSVFIDRVTRTVFDRELPVVTSVEEARQIIQSQRAELSDSNESRAR